MIDMSKINQNWATPTGPPQGIDSSYSTTPSFQVGDPAANNPYAGGNGWQDNLNMGYMPQDTGGTDNLGYGLNGSGFLFPESWDASVGAMQGIANQNVPVPSAWQTGMGALTPMAQTGQPISSDPWWASMQAVTNQNRDDAIKAAAEQAGLGGMRWSTPLGRTAQDISGRYQNEANLAWLDRESAAQEAARQRQLEATGQLYNYGQGQYQMSQDQIARQMAAAGAGAANDQRKIDLVFRTADWTSDQAYRNYQMDRQTIADSYNNPYMNYGQDFLNSQPSGMPETFQPSLGTNVLGLAGAAAPYIGDLIFGQNEYGGGGFWK